MVDAWQILRDGGLPLAIEGTGQRRDAADLAAAVRAAIAEAPTGRDADALAAFVLGWQHHWPRGFAGAHGDAAAAVIAWAEAHVGDAGRYIKLRRIAIENLSRVL